MFIVMIAAMTFIHSSRGFKERPFKVTTQDLNSAKEDR